MSLQGIFALIGGWLAPEHVVQTAIVLGACVVSLVVLLSVGCMVTRRRRMRRLGDS